jgi:hypothetical protein
LEDNSYVCAFRSLGNLPNLDEYRIELNTDVGVDQRRYNVSTISQVAAIWEGVTLQNNLGGASWSVAPLESHNISKHIMDVMTLFCIHYFSLEVRLVGTRKYCMQTKAMSLKVCVFICECDFVYCSLFSQLVSKQYLMFQLLEM